MTIVTQAATGCALFLLLGAGGEAAGAAAYPTKPLRLIVGSSPGGPLDLVARRVGPKISEALGQTIVVDNRAGAGGTIAAESVARAAPDGYTLFLGSATTLCIAPHLYPRIGYDTLRDFAPVSTVVGVPHVLVVHPSQPVKTVKEFIAYAKARPGQLTFASGGIGTFTHLGPELFKTMAGIDAVHVPYKGAGRGVIDLLGGQIEFMLNRISTSTAHILTGRLRALAVSGAVRSPLLPGVPTISEAALPGYEASTWFGVVAPAGTPRHIVAQLNGIIVNSLANAATREEFLAQGLDPLSSTPEAFTKLLRQEMPKWRQAVQTSGARVD